MRFFTRVLPATLFVLTVIMVPPGRAQTEAQQTENKATVSPDAKPQKTNTDAYIALLRRNVRQEKAEIMGAMMVLNAQDSAKFWPIYSEYDAALTKLNDQRIAIIKEYAHAYNQITDDDADKLVQNSMAYRKQRAELFAATYAKVKQALGAVTAARFAMVEDQLLLLIDLQIVSSLPVVGQSQ
jgi:hypothetical protein